MDNIDFARLSYLMILGLAVAAWFLTENRASFGKTARQVVVWGLIFIGMIAAYGLWGDIRNDVMARQSYIGARTIEVSQSFDGHYYLVLHMNDVPVKFIVDTGASDVVLTQKDARRIGLDPNELNFFSSANTANGVVKTAHARVRDVRLGDIQDNNLSVSVNGGQMQDSLLGMTYLSRFRKIEISGDRLVLTR